MAHSMKYYRYYINTRCSACGAEKLRRRDMKWGGFCRKCATRMVANRPEIKAILSDNGRRTPPPRQNVKNYRRGKDNHLWRGGITPETVRIRTSPEMRRWRQSVFERDNYTCRICQHRGGDLHADHIKPFALYPELRFDIDNGRTLCVRCHQMHGALVSAGRLIRQSSDGTNWLIA